MGNCKPGTGNGKWNLAGWRAVSYYLGNLGIKKYHILALALALQLELGIVHCYSRSSSLNWKRFLL